MRPFLSKTTVPVTTAADGTASVVTSPLHGLLESIQYIKPSTGSYADGVDFTITNTQTGETVWTQSNVNASVTKHPRTLVQDTGGSDISGDYGNILFVADTLTIALASGGDTKHGTFVIRTYVA